MYVVNSKCFLSATIEQFKNEEQRSARKKFC